MCNNKFLNKCKNCNRSTLLVECAGCLRGDPIKPLELQKEEKPSIKSIVSIMDIHKLKVIRFSKNPTFIDSGNNTLKNKKEYTWATTTEIIDKKFLSKNNWGIICNKKTGVMGVDLDTHKWEPDNLFYKKFGKDFIKKFNTYTQKTPNGGYHLVFKYDKDLNQTESKLNSKFGKGIDIRNGHEDRINSGGYLLGAGSIFKKKDGTYGEYKIINDVPVSIINPELKTWLLDNIYNEIELKQQTKKDFKQKFNIETEILNNTYKYYITESQFNEYILNDIDSTYLEDYGNWFKLTSCMKTLNFKKLWNTFSKKSKNYMKNKNEEIWQKIKITGGSYYVETIFKECGKTELLNIIKYKPTCRDIIPAHLTITRSKLSHVENETGTPLKLNLKDTINYVIKSDTGTGKTTLIKRELYDSSQKFISIVSRVSLGKEQYHNFNEYGINCKFYKNSWTKEGDSIITTIDSLMACGELMKNISEYTIFIDEFNSVIEYLLQADTCLNKVRSKIWKYLIHILTHCKNFVCVDADISDMSLKLLQKLKLKYQYINNEYKHNKDVGAIEFFDLEKLITEIKKHPKYIVCCDSKKSAEYIFIHTGKTAKLLTSSTDKLNNETLDDFNQIIFSPSIIYGLDSSMNRPVFVYHKECTISPKNMLQQVARCRDIKQLYYCFNKQKFKANTYSTILDATEHVKIIKEITISEFDVLDEQENYRQEIFNELYIDYIYKQDIYNTNKYIHFKLLLESRGYILSNNEIKKTSVVDKEKINEDVEKYKIDTFDINSNQIQEFNKKYLGLTQTQLLDIKDIFIKDAHEINTIFLMKRYFTGGKKNNPLFNLESANTAINLDQLKSRKITQDQLANYYDYDEQYDLLTHQPEMKIKKIGTTKFKFYMIDKFKVLCDYTGYWRGDITNTLCARKIPEPKDIAKWIKLYKIAFNYRGKKDIVINSTNDCEKILYDMFKKTFGGSIYDKKKIRESKTKVSMLYYLNPENELMKYAIKILQYQQKNSFNKELNYEINRRFNKYPQFIDELD